jgi:hypothetical protein
MGSPGRATLLPTLRPACRPDGPGRSAGVCASSGLSSERSGRRLPAATHGPSSGTQGSRVSRIEGRSQAPSERAATGQAEEAGRSDAATVSDGSSRRRRLLPQETTPPAGDDEDVVPGVPGDRRVVTLGGTSTATMPPLSGRGWVTSAEANGRPAASRAVVDEIPEREILQESCDQVITQADVVGPEASARRTLATCPAPIATRR